jgi:4-hydroxy-tetrahydrodipicolinate synthase
VGPEELLAEALILGGHGGVAGGANLFPKLYASLYRAAVAGNLETVRQLHELVMQINATIYSTGQYGSSFLKGVKCSLNLMGICSDFVAEPFHRFRQPEREKIQRHLEQIQVKLGSLNGLP